MNQNTPALKLVTDNGAQPAEPQVGDLWALAWDTHDLALGMIAAVKPSFVLVWPVTLPGTPAYQPALDVPCRALASNVYLWPTRETGLGLHLLDRPLGTLLTARAVHEIDAVLTDGGTPAVPWASGEYTDEADRAMINLWEGLCFHTEDRGAIEPVLDPRKTHAAGIDPARAFDAIGGEWDKFLSIWRGQTPPAPEVSERLRDALNIDVEALLDVSPQTPYYDTLSSPRFKRKVTDIATRRRISETAARKLVVDSAYANAARDDGRDRIERTLTDALERLALPDE